MNQTNQSANIRHNYNLMGALVGVIIAGVILHFTNSEEQSFQQTKVTSISVSTATYEPMSADDIAIRSKCSIHYARSCTYPNGGIGVTNCASDGSRICTSCVDAHQSTNSLITIPNCFSISGELVVQGTKSPCWLSAHTTGVQECLSSGVWSECKLPSPSNKSN